MDKKIVNTKILNDYEVLSEDGWKNIKAIHKTIDYEIYIFKTENKMLECADNHIVFLDGYENIYVKDLKIGDNIITKDGIEEIIDIKKTGYYEEMYDLELDDNNFKYYTNDILSHNTYYIRYLLSKLTKEDKNILYFPPSMINSITDPSFVNFINSWINDNEKSCIILIEDAEPLLVSRNNDDRNMGITNLLNLTDGVLNDIFGIQIIATFNTDLNSLDDALLRPERLIARKEFNPLSKNRSIELFEKLKIDKNRVKDNMTLAEIYSIKKKNEILLHDVNDKRIKIGFN